MSENSMYQDTFQLSDLENGGDNGLSIKGANRLQYNGYLKLEIDENCSLTLHEKQCLTQWETVFHTAFQCSEEIKVNKWKTFETIKGYTVGYRVDGKREFIESRLSGTSATGIEPELSLMNSEETEKYVTLVKSIVQIYHKIGITILKCMAESLGVDERYFLDLIDEVSSIVTPSHKTETSGNVENLVTDMLSSSLLRVCNYPLISSDDDNTSIAFGAHTDVSLITLGLCSSYPGLEIRDLRSGQWVQVEREVLEGKKDSDCINCSLKEGNEPAVCASSSSSALVMAVFVGDIMQLLTRSVYKATAHRVVVTPLSSSPSSINKSDGTQTIVPTDNDCIFSNFMPSRLSCPYILRGRHPAVIPPVAAYSRFPATLAPESFHSGQLSPKKSTPSGVPVTSNLPPPVTVSSIKVDEPDNAGDRSSDITYPELPDLEGSSMKLIHKLLDLKRQKCLRENSDNADEDWVLSAYRTTIPSESI
jgi:hypothetical protein